MPQLDQVIKSIQDLTEQWKAFNVAFYRFLLEQKTEEQLKQEFEDRIGNALREFENMMSHYGRQHIEDYLVDTYQVEHDK